MPHKFDVKRGETETIKKIKYRKWYATVDGSAGTSFSFAYETPRPGSKNKRGLTFDHEINNYGLQYDPNEYRSVHGHWADFIFPMAQCETRGYFNAVNTWDKAFFSFGFVQMTVENADKQFIPTFRKLLKSPKAADYFPDLALREVKGKEYIHLKLADGKYVQLETKTKADKLQMYLNPTAALVEQEEAERTARLAHWATSEKSHRDIQVNVVIENLKERLKNAWSNFYAIDGKLDIICLVVCDIHHQGRAVRSTVQKVFQEAAGDDEKLYQGLLEVGRKADKLRRVLLDAEIKKLVANGVLGKKKYHKATNDFA